MVLVTPHTPSRVIEILRREMDGIPSLLRSLLTLNARYFRGTSAVCGRITRAGFELRSRGGPAFSLRAHGTLSVASDGLTEIELRFSRPRIPDLLGSALGRYRQDQQQIVAFLGKHLAAIDRGRS